MNIKVQTVSKPVSDFTTLLVNNINIIINLVHI